MKPGQMIYSDWIYLSRGRGVTLTFWSLILILSRNEDNVLLPHFGILETLNICRTR